MAQNKIPQTQVVHALSAVIKTLSKMGFHTVIAIITLPNEKSVALHERLGFGQLGTVEQVGYKFGRWHSTGIWQQHLEKEPTACDEEYLSL